MSGAEVDVTALPVGAAVETIDDVHDGRLDGPLYRVVAVRGALRDVRRIEATMGILDGIELRFLAAELRPARAIPWADVATAWRAALNRWCLSVTGSMMGCVVADGGFGVGRRDEWL